MPKWHAARGYGDFANDPSLSPFEIGLIASWAGGGAPKRLPRTPTPETELVKPAVVSEPEGQRIEVGCGDVPLTGRLLAVRPVLTPGTDAAISVRFPDGRQEIVAWIRGYDPAFPATYVLRRPLDLPEGSVFSTRADGRCGVTLVTERDRTTEERR
jgi:hypothetical protein